MTRRLVLIRHAKTEQGADDVARRLTDRGRRDAAAIGRWLTEHDVVPDHVIVSPAVRAAETWSIATGEVAAATAATATDERIYENSPDDVVAAIRSAPKSAGTLAVVGHNPSFAALVSRWGGTGGDFPTASVAVFDTSQRWDGFDGDGLTLTASATCRG